MSLRLQNPNLLGPTDKKYGSTNPEMHLSKAY